MVAFTPPSAFARCLLDRPPAAPCNGTLPRVCLRRMPAGRSTAAAGAPARRRRFNAAGIWMVAAADGGSKTPDESPSSSSTPPASGDAGAGADPGASPVEDGVMDADVAARAARASEAELRDALMAAADDADQLRADHDALTEERLFILKMKRDMHPDDWRRIFDPKNRRIGDFM